MGAAGTGAGTLFRGFRYTTKFFLKLVTNRKPPARILNPPPPLPPPPYSLSHIPYSIFHAPCAILHGKAKELWTKTGTKRSGGKGEGKRGAGLVVRFYYYVKMDGQVYGRENHAQSSLRFAHNNRRGGKKALGVARMYACACVGSDSSNICAWTGYLPGRYQPTALVAMGFEVMVLEGRERGGGRGANSQGDDNHNKQQQQTRM